MKHSARVAALALGAFATVALAACAGDPLSPDPAAARSPDVSLRADAVTTEDSVQSGYGSSGTGGIEYETFEYDPETGTEYVPTTDPDPPTKGMTFETLPPPAYSTTSASSDSVYTGYGSGSTGGIEYEPFEYEPETGTEYVVTPDSTSPPPGPQP